MKASYSKAAFVPFHVPSYILARIHYGMGVAVVGTLGIAFLHTVASGQVKTLLHPLLQPLVIGGGWALLATAILLVALAPQQVRPMTGWFFVKNTVRDLLLAGAVVAGVAFAPHSFSSLTLTNRSTLDSNAVLRGKTLDADAPAWKPDAGGVIALETVDLLMASTHEGTIRELEGQKVRFIGQFVANGKGIEGFKAVRLLMFCCAADAQPVSVQVHGTAPDLDKGSWCEVTGTVHFVEKAGGKHLPEITLETVKGIPEPTDSNKFVY